MATLAAPFRYDELEGAIRENTKAVFGRYSLPVIHQPFKNIFPLEKV